MAIVEGIDPSRIVVSKAFYVAYLERGNKLRKEMGAFHDAYLYPLGTNLRKGISESGYDLWIE